MKGKIILSLTVLVTSIYMFGCINEREAALAEKEQYEVKIERKLDELDDRIAQLRAESQAAGEGLGMQLENQVLDLQNKRAALSERLMQLWTGTEEEWEELKGKIDQQFAELEKALAEEYHTSLNMS